MEIIDRSSAEQGSPEPWYVEDPRQVEGDADTWFLPAEAFCPPVEQMAGDAAYQELLGRLNEHQLAAVAVNEGPAAVLGVPGCLCGDTAMYYLRGARKSGRLITLGDMFAKFNSMPTRRRGWEPETGTYVQSLNTDGVVYYNPVLAIQDSGRRECLRIRTEGGAELSCTYDHPIMVANDTYALAGSLSARQSVLLKGDMLPKYSGGKKRGKCRKVVTTKYHRYGTVRLRENKYIYKEVPYQRIVVEAALNDMTPAEFVRILKTDASKAAKLLFLPPELEIHHVDGNPDNNVLHNLRVLSKVEHSRLHSKLENFSTEYTTVDTITEIKSLGRLCTFDVKMAAPDYNFAAGKFFVHNSGKSSTLVARIARLVREGTPDKKILAMTFTRAAAAELNERLAKLGVQKARVGTIHSVSRQIVAADTPLLKMYKFDSRKRLRYQLKKVHSELRRAGTIPKQGLDMEIVERFISDCKSGGVCYCHDDFFSLNRHADTFMGRAAMIWAPETGARPEHLIHLYQVLEDRRAELGLYDFDDMMLWSWMLLVSSPTALTTWRDRWSQIICDEQQDSTPIQWDLGRFLVGLDSCIVGLSEEVPSAPQVDQLRSHNLMVAGDSSQSIYSFRNAVPGAFVDFFKHQEVKGLVLPINYRSNKKICDITTRIVRGQPWHLGGTIKPFSEEPGELSVSLENYLSPEEEAAEAVKRCLLLVADGTHRLTDCAILARLNVPLHLVEVECIRKRVPYVKMASGSLFDCKEVKDILAYLRVAGGFDPRGDWLRHIINRPFRYISNLTINKAQQDATNHGVSLLDAMIEFGKIGFSQKSALRKLYKLLIDLNQTGTSMEEFKAEIAKAEAAKDSLKLQLLQEVDRPTVGNLVSQVLKETNYVESLRREDGLNSIDESKVSLLNEIQRIGHMFFSITEFLSYVDTLAGAIEMSAKSGLKLKEGSRDGLVLSTIHRSKGLQYKHVSLIDVTAGHFPCSRSDNPDEELRLLYVAVSRAESSCTISYSSLPKKMDVDSKIVDSNFIELLKTAGARYC